MTTMACTSAPLCAQTARFFPAGDEHSPARIENTKIPFYHFKHEKKLSHPLRGVKHVETANKKKGRKTQQSTIHLCHLMTELVAWQHLQTTMVSPSEQVERFTVFLTLPMRNLQKRMGPGLPNKKDMKKMSSSSIFTDVHPIL